MFPPTNAPADDPRRLAKEPALVSIIDLQRLLGAEEQRAKQAPAPLATFALVEGCNFVSFSSDGLRLLTSNRKGESTSIWDLKHVAHGSTKPGSGDEAEAELVPHVKLIHRIARSSPSVIVDSVWSRDGDWVALLTAHGTVHLHEAPLTASRKRKRRATVSAPVPDKAEPSVSVTHSVSPPSNGFFGSVRSWGANLGSQVEGVKKAYASPTTFAGLRETAALARTAGQRAVSKGLASGYTAAKSGASDMWHAEDNKIRLKTLPEGGARPGVMHWVQRQSTAVMAVVHGGTVWLHPVERVTRRKGEVMVSGLKRDKHHRAYALPRIGTGKEGGAKAVERGADGFWNLDAASTASDKVARAPSAVAATAVTGANEVETNPPYCPFHVDRRVNIFAFEDSGYASEVNLQEDALLAFKSRGLGYEEEDQEPWLFGGPLPASTKLNERSQDDEVPRPRARGVRNGIREVESEDEMAAMVESRLSIHPASEGDGEEIRVRSSRRVRHGRQRDEGGFDDVDDDDGDSLI